MTVEVIIVALLAGIAGGAVAAVTLGAIQARMAMGSGSRSYVSFARHAPGFEHASSSGSSQPRMSPVGPFDRFSDSAKRVLALAQDEAIRHNHNYIGTEHILCALLRDDTVAARALTSLGIDLTKVRTAVEFIVGRGDQTTRPTEITLSPRTKRVLEFAGAEAAQMGQPHVGAEHILLGIVDEGEGIASGVLESLGVQLEPLRTKVIELLNESGTPTPLSYAPPLHRHPSGPFDRFSNRSKRALALAQDEAVRMGHNYIGPEHLLLGLARMGGMPQSDQAMKEVFAQLNLTVEKLRAELAEIIPPIEPKPHPSEIVLSPETKEIFEVVVRESGPEVGVLPEHLLLAIVRNEESFAVQMLARLNVTAEKVRRAVGH